MDADDILARQVEQLDREKRELQLRLKTQEKKVRILSIIGNHLNGSLLCKKTISKPSHKSSCRASFMLFI